MAAFPRASADAAFTQRAEAARPMESASQRVREGSPSGYRPALDGVRAIAVSAVVAYHFGVGSLQGGFVGVDVFFVLSGYLITSILLAEYARSGHISLSGFYVRRLSRLFPALALVILTVVVGTALYASPLQLQDRFHDMLGALFYYANWHFLASDQSYFAGLSGASPLRHTWSLAIEEQFYFVWPLMLLMLLRLGALRRRWVLVVGITLGIALSAMAMSAAFDPVSPSRAYYGSDGRVQQLLVGVLLAVALFGLGRATRLSRTWGLLGLVGFASVLVIANRYNDQADFYYKGGALLVALVTALLIASVERGPSGPVARLLSLGPVAWLGRISYGVYLWHWPLMVWISAPPGASQSEQHLVTLLRVALTLLVATASFYLVERPIRLGHVPWIRRSPRRTVAAFVGCLVLLSSAAYATTRPDVQQHLVQKDLPAGLISQAAVGSVTACPHDPAPCVRVAAPSGAPVLATVGDSTMQAYDKGLMVLARSHGFRYVQGAVGGCPIGHRLLATGIDGEQFKASNHKCFAEMPNIFRELVEQRKADVILATSANEQSRSIGSDGQTLAPGTPAHLAATEAALEQSVAYLTSRGAYVVLVHSLPRGPGVACLDSGPVTGPRCNIPVSRDTLTPQYNNILDQVAAQHPARVRVVDLSDVVCPKGVCSLLVDGVVMRYDGGHFTKRASEYVAPFLYDRIRKAGVPLP